MVILAHGIEPYIFRLCRLIIKSGPAGLGAPPETLRWSSNKEPDSLCNRRAVLCVYSRPCREELVYLCNLHLDRGVRSPILLPEPQLPLWPEGAICTCFHKHIVNSQTESKGVCPSVILALAERSCVGPGLYCCRTRQ